MGFAAAVGKSPRVPCHGNEWLCRRTDYGLRSSRLTGTSAAL